MQKQSVSYSRIFPNTRQSYVCNISIFFFIVMWKHLKVEANMIFVEIDAIGFVPC